jgi:hypothetical protein
VQQKAPVMTSLLLRIYARRVVRYQNHFNISFSLLRLLSGKKRSESWTHGVSLLRFPQSRESGFGCRNLNRRPAAGTGAGIGDS